MANWTGTCRKADRADQGKVLNILEVLRFQGVTLTCTSVFGVKFLF